MGGLISTRKVVGRNKKQKQDFSAASEVTKNLLLRRPQAAFQLINFLIQSLR